MQKLVIETQYLENYGDSENPYMKFKGGSTYVLTNCGDLDKNEIATTVARVKPYITTDLQKSNGGSESYIIDVKVVPLSEKIVADWDSATEFTFDGNNVNFIKIEDNRGEFSFMKEEILEVTITKTNDRENYKEEFLMEDGDSVIGQEGLREWFEIKEAA